MFCNHRQLWMGVGRREKESKPCPSSPCLLLSFICIFGLKRKQLKPKMSFLKGFVKRLGILRGWLLCTYCLAYKPSRWGRPSKIISFRKLSKSHTVLKLPKKEKETKQKPLEAILSSLNFFFFFRTCSYYELVFNDCTLTSRNKSEGNSPQSSQFQLKGYTHLQKFSWSCKESVFSCLSLCFPVGTGPGEGAPSEMSLAPGCVCIQGIPLLK